MKSATQNLIIKLILTLFLFSCSSLNNLIKNSYAELNPDSGSLIKDLAYNKRIGLGIIFDSKNSIEIRHYKYRVLSHTTSLWILTKNGDRCKARLFVESNVPDIFIREIDVTEVKACELIKELLINNIHKLSDYNDVYEKMKNENPLYEPGTDGTSFYVEIKLLDKIVTSNYP